MIFYEMLDNSSFEMQWAVAPHIQPKSHVIQWECPECGRAAEYPAGDFDVVVEGGIAFPDLLSCGAYPLLIVSDKVSSLLRHAGINCFQEFPVAVSAVQDSQLRAVDAPRYVRVEITGECMIDFLASGATIQSICKRCGELTTQPDVIRRFALLPGSWDGSDLFRDHRYFPRVTFATPRLVELVKANGLTNFRFKQMS
jgi:hypothetical protein